MRAARHTQIERAVHEEVADIESNRREVKVEPMQDPDTITEEMIITRTKNRNAPSSDLAEETSSDICLQSSH